MIKTQSTKHGQKVKAKITLELSVYLKDGDKREEISEEEAKNLVLKDLDYLSGSNDGSELLANIGKEDISF